MAIIKDPARKRTPSISAPAWEVLAHLSEHPCLQDTLEGITEWWVLEQRIRYLVAETRAALGELVAGRFVLTRQGNEGRTYYRINRSKLPIIRALLDHRHAQAESAASLSK